jgi:hypothetical protein
MLNQPEAKVNAPAKIVTLLDGRVYDLASWESAPKIGVAHSENPMPGRASSAATAKELGKSDAGVNCLSCHDPHSSPAQHLLRKAAAGRSAVEKLGYHSNFMGVNGVPQNVPVHQGSILGGRS